MQDFDMRPAADLGMSLRERLRSPRRECGLLHSIGHWLWGLATRGYFRLITIHRVVPNFVVQDGDPRGDGWGGPGFLLRDEVNPMRYETGTIGMALSGPDTGGSQFFITHSAQPHLDGIYTIFGRVVGSADVLNAIGVGDRIRSIHR